MDRVGEGEAPYASGMGSEVTAENSPDQKSISKRESSTILLASLISAVSALGATFIAKHALSGEGVTEFLVFWSALFGIYGIVSGVQQETTRAVGAAELNRRVGTGPSSGTRVMLVAAGFGVAIAAVVGLSSPFWAQSQVPTGMGWAVFLMCFGSCLYAVHVAMSGAAAGRQKWFQFSGLGGGEAAWRLIAMIVVALFAGSLGGLEAATVSPVLLWILIAAFTREGRKTFAVRADVGAGRFVQNILFAMGSSTASAVLMVGLPVVLKASVGDDASSNTKIGMGALILAISITRSPIMIPLQAFQGVAISAFLKQRHRPVAAMAKPVGALLGIGALGAALAWVIGPWLFFLIYGPKPEEAAAYHEVIHGWLLGSLTFGSAIMALLVLSGTAVLALNAHRLYIIGWVVAAILAAALLFLPLDLVPRTVIALYVGPAVGFAVHLIGMVLISRRTPRPTPLEESAAVDG
ncbi:hypothetical protein [uncultured Kocuria sp.]|uniref:hypothetical protein n=1 Tax=uncultured Kocuria sp. TaxID=259305 RepID=UPI002598BA5F|nr:hypothetical protein [uncultured Kocuria sp.]MCT1367014.1 hypothetical protein [Rothia sp. p3-SID1597]